MTEPAINTTAIMEPFMGDVGTNNEHLFITMNDVRYEIARADACSYGIELTAAPIVVRNDFGGRWVVMRLLESMYNAMEHLSPIHMVMDDDNFITVTDAKTERALAHFSVGADSPSACIRDIVKHSKEWS